MNNPEREYDLSKQWEAQQEYEQSLSDEAEWDNFFQQGEAPDADNL